MTTPRDLITKRIARQVRLFPDLDITAPDVSGLSAQDTALAMAIDHAIARRWLTLTAVVESRLSRPWEELEGKLQAALLVGAAQLLLMDRLPDHAVINEAVQWAKDNVRPKAGGLVNAVLRKVAALRVERLPQIQFSDPPLPLPRDLLTIARLHFEGNQKPRAQLALRRLLLYDPVRTAEWAGVRQISRRE